MYPARPGSFRGHAGADGGDRQLRPDFRLRTLTTPQGTPIVARREVSPSSMDTEASFGKQAGKLAEWRKSSTVYEELQESDSDEA